MIFSVEEQLMYEVMRAVYESGIPVSFKAWYCDVRDSIIVKVKTAKPLKIKKPVVFDDIIGGEFFNYGKRVANIEGEYTFKSPNKKLW